MRNAEPSKKSDILGTKNEKKNWKFMTFNFFQKHYTKNN